MPRCLHLRVRQRLRHILYLQRRTMAVRQPELRRMCPFLPGQPHAGPDVLLPRWNDLRRHPLLSGRHGRSNRRPVHGGRVGRRQQGFLRPTPVRRGRALFPRLLHPLRRRPVRFGRGVDVRGRDVRPPELHLQRRGGGVRDGRRRAQLLRDELHVHERHRGLHLLGRLRRGMSAPTARRSSLTPRGTANPPPASSARRASYGMRAAAPSLRCRVGEEFLSREVQKDDVDVVTDAADR